MTDFLHLRTWAIAPRSTEMRATADTVAKARGRQRASKETAGLGAGPQQRPSGLRPEKRRPKDAGRRRRDTGCRPQAAGRRPRQRCQISSLKDLNTGCGRDHRVSDLEDAGHRPHDTGHRV